MPVSGATRIVSAIAVAWHPIQHRGAISTEIAQLGAKPAAKMNTILVSEGALSGKGAQALAW